MLDRPTELPQTDSPAHTLSKLSAKAKIQHGINHISYPILNDVPVETLTGITSHLDPPALYALAQVNRRLYLHISDDNTWRRAFALQFLGIQPEDNLDDEKNLLLRRSERSWRQELISHYVLVRRWERSRNVTTTHVPVHSTISDMRLISSQALLTSSITYGIVARSIPLTGKVLSGYLDASGVRAGLGIGNPNAEFTPNVTSCAMTSDGGTAKIVWGSRAGHLIFTTAPRAMETSRRSAADIKRCRVVDEHEGAVIDVQWLDSWVLSGGSDSRVKIWDSKTANCVWASDPNLLDFVPDRCLKVAACMQHGFVASVHASGDIHLWTGFNFSGRTFSDVKAQVIKCPLRTAGEQYGPQIEHNVKTLSVDNASSTPTILVAYENDPYFYRIRVDLATKRADTTAFGDPNFGYTSVVVPFFRTDTEQREQSSFVFVGDHLGCVSLYAWDTDAARASPATQAVGPLRKLEAHRDGASVTAISWNGLTLITGSARGTTHVWDALTFAPLRSFASPVPRLRGPAAHPGVNVAERECVRHILVSAEKDVLFVGVGDRVMAWRAGAVPKNTPGGVRGRHPGGALGKKRASNAKYLGQLELKQTIQESQNMIKEESKHSKRTFGREREHRTGLDKLGLSEAEAVEYVLMLSRDEAAANASFDAEEGIFEDDFEDDFEDEFALESHEAESTTSSRRPSIGTSGVSAPRAYSSASSSAPSSVSPSSSQHSVASHRSGMTMSRTRRPIPRVTPAEPGSNEKVRVSPPFREEPLEAGAVYRAGDGPAEGTRMCVEEHFFPPISANASAGSSPADRIPAASYAQRRAAKAKANTPPAVSPAQTPGGSPTSARASAWNVPLRKPIQTPGASPASSAPRNAWAAGSPPAWVPQQPRQQSRGGSGSSAIAYSGAPAAASSLDDMDDDLRFALELSLAEAMSRKQEE